jgi:hypothetical protein
MCKEKLVNHLEANEKIIEYQSGFTKGRRLEDNILLYKYCVQESRRMKKSMVVVAVDFAKAFDSVDRKQLVLALKRYKCDPRLIDLIVELYSGDKTELYLNNNKVGEIEINNGIRQACTGSPWLFVMIVNYIIEKLMERRIGFKNDKLFIPVLFFADDGLLVAHSVDDMVKMMSTLTEAATEVGLKINKEKSNALVYNMKEKPIEINGVKVVSQLKYLGITVSDTNDIFGVHKKNKLQLAQKMSNLTYSVIVRSCNKLLIGKTYWKSVVLPSLLFASSVVVWNKGELEQLQKVENSVWRHILGAPGYAPKAAMRGDIGASCMVTRDMKVKLKYLQGIMVGSCEMKRRVIIDMFHQQKDQLARTIGLYMEALGYEGLQDVVKRREEEILGDIEKYDRGLWREELARKSTLDLYATHKRDIREETFYEDTFESSLLFRARSNSLKLGWRRKFEGKSVHCQLCQSGETETLKHFLVECCGLQLIRSQHLMHQHTIDEMLLFVPGVNSDQFIGAMWKERGRILKAQIV